MKNENVLEVRNLLQKFGDKVIFGDLSFKVEKGKILGIIGKSGCGKSTLLRIIAGFNEPFIGSVVVDKKVHRKPTKNVIYLHQDFNQLFMWLNVRQNIGFNVKKDKNLNSRIDGVLELVGLKEQEKMYPFELSGRTKTKSCTCKSTNIKTRFDLNG